MSFSRVFKGGGDASLSPLSFMDFDEPGSGQVVESSPGMVFEDDSPPQQLQGKSATAQERPFPKGPTPGDTDALLADAYARGQREAKEEMEERLGAAVKAFSLSLEEIGRLRETILKNSTDDMLRLVQAIAEQVIHCEVTTNSEVIFQILNKALEVAVRSDAFHVRVNPEDLAVAMEKKPLLLASISGLKNITFAGDAEVSRGGCILESELGEVDATVESQLEEIRQKVLMAAVGS